MSLRVIPRNAARVAIVVYSGVIDGEKRESIKIVDPHGLGVVVEQHSWLLKQVASLALACLAGSHSLALLCDGLLKPFGVCVQAHQEDETEREHA